VPVGFAVRHAAPPAYPTTTCFRFAGERSEGYLWISTQMPVGLPVDVSRSSRMFGSGPQAVTSSKMPAAPADPGPAAFTRAPAWLVRRRALSFDRRSSAAHNSIDPAGESPALGVVRLPR
jgi:hypothetical protein